LEYPKRPGSGFEQAARPTLLTAIDCRRFATLKDVVEHYNAHFKLKLTEAEASDLAEYLKSL